MQLDIGDYAIRSFRLDDVAAICEHLNNTAITSNLRNIIAAPYREEDAIRWIVAAQRQTPEQSFAISHDGVLVGGIGFRFCEDVYSGSAELGYWLAPEHWGRGVMTRAVRAITDYAFAHYGHILRVYAGVFSQNPASARVLEKAGYKLEGRLRSHVTKNGVVQDEMIYSRLRSESG